MRNERSAACGGDPEAIWRERIVDWSHSGETVTGYCERRGLSRWSFYDWKRRLKHSAGAASGFVQVHVVEGGAERASPRAVPAAAADSAGVEVVLSSGRKLRLERGFDPATLSAAVAVLEGTAC